LRGNDPHTDEDAGVRQVVRETSGRRAGDGEEALVYFLISIINFPAFGTLARDDFLYALSMIVFNLVP
jgi:hypothetical protein